MGRNLQKPHSQQSCEWVFDCPDKYRIHTTSHEKCKRKYLLARPLAREPGLYANPITQIPFETELQRSCNIWIPQGFQDCLWCWATERVWLSFDSGTPFQCYCKTMTGKTIPLVVSAGLPVFELKRLIQGKEGIPPDQHRLIFAGVQMANWYPLGHYNIEEGSVMHLVLTLRGCWLQRRLLHDHITMHGSKRTQMNAREEKSQSLM